MLFFVVVVVIFTFYSSKYLEKSFTGSKKY